MKLWYKDDYIKLLQGNCLEVMDKMIEKNVKVDMILTDPPYGTTDCNWDTIIPFDKMWDRINKIIKENTAILLFGNEPFSSLLRTSNLDLYKYDWKWDKIQGANFLNVKYQPLKNIEDICVFSLGRITNGKRTAIKYNPQGFVEKIEQKTNTSNYEGTFGSSSVKKGKKFQTTGTGYPKCIIQFPKDKDKLHPTQKPIALLEYVIHHELNHFIVPNHSVDFYNELYKHLPNHRDLQKRLKKYSYILRS